MTKWIKKLKECAKEYREEHKKPAKRKSKTAIKDNGDRYMLPTAPKRKRKTAIKDNGDRYMLPAEPKSVNKGRSVKTKAIKDNGDRYMLPPEPKKPRVRKEKPPPKPRVRKEKPPPKPKRIKKDPEEERQRKAAERTARYKQLKDSRDQRRKTARDMNTPLALRYNVPPLETEVNTVTNNGGVADVLPPENISIATSDIPLNTAPTKTRTKKRRNMTRAEQEINDRPHRRQTTIGSSVWTYLV